MLAIAPFESRIKGKCGIDARVPSIGLLGCANSLASQFFKLGSYRCLPEHDVMTEGAPAVVVQLLALGGLPSGRGPQRDAGGREVAGGSTRVLHLRQGEARTCRFY